MKWNDKRLRFAELGRSSTMLTIHPELLHRIWKGRFYSNFFIFLVRLNFIKKIFGTLGLRVFVLDFYEI